MKLLDYPLDFLMFIVPMLELTELVAIIPVTYLPYYMLSTVVLRRLLRLLEQHLKKGKVDEVDQ